MEHERQPSGREVDDPVDARPSGPYGKLDAEGKYKIDSQTMDVFRRLCAEHGTDPSSEVRNYVYEVVHGKSYDEMVLEKQQHAVRQRRSLLAGVRGLFGATKGPPK